MLNEFGHLRNFLARAGQKRGRRRSLPRHRTRKLRMEALEQRTVLAVLIVNSPDDTHINSDGTLCLREAIEVVNSQSASGLDSTAQSQISGTLGANDTIVFYGDLENSLVTLTKANGQIAITRSVTIDATEIHNRITVKGEDDTPSTHNDGRGIRLFNITDATNGAAPPIVTMVGMTLTGADPAGSSFESKGGAIRSEGLLTLRNMTITDNGAVYGGGIYVVVAPGGTGTRNILTIDSSQMNHNSALFDGGGVYVMSKPGLGATDTVWITASSFIQDAAGTPISYGKGGAIFTTYNHQSLPAGNSALTISNTKFDANRAHTGGGLFLDGWSEAVSITGSNISNNAADLVSQIQGSEFDVDTGSGGGVFAKLKKSSSLNISNSVITGNSAKKKMVVEYSRKHIRIQKTTFRPYAPLPSHIHWFLITQRLTEAAASTLSTSQAPKRLYKNLA